LGPDLASSAGSPTPISLPAISHEGLRFRGENLFMGG